MICLSIHIWFLGIYFALNTDLLLLRYLYQIFTIHGLFTSKLSLILYFRYSSCEYLINIPLMKDSTKLYLLNIKSTVLQNECSTLSVRDC